MADKKQTPYAATRAWIRGRQGEKIWTMALKATWDIRPDGTTTLSDTQQQVNVGSVMNFDDNTLLYDTDLGPVKNATDIPNKPQDACQSIWKLSLIREATRVAMPGSVCSKNVDIAS
ncbi:DUF2169 domain-containing protein [Salmonella enterica]|nr:DUF2169 domain-containing protein [Salmonella enterica]